MCMMQWGDRAVFSESIDFSNTKTGFNQLVKWARREALKEYPILFLMEPTGTYYEDLANHLNKLSFTIYVVQPKRVHAFFKEEGIRTKTDAIDAWGLSLMGSSKPHLKPWSPPSPGYKELRSLTRFGADLTKLRTQLISHRESVSHSYEPSRLVLKEIDSLLRSVERKIQNNLDNIKEAMIQYPEIREQVQYVESIKGIGTLTAVTIIAETEGFTQMNSRKQVASFAGLDVVARDSGTSNPKRHISKAGNVHIRRALYMCTLTATIHNPQMRAMYARLALQKSSRVARTAIMRKLLTLSYTLCKNKKMYDPQKN